MICHINFDCVLIDTWWNVNPDPADTFALLVEVLIDTWWNVNLVASSLDEIKAMF